LASAVAGRAVAALRLLGRVGHSSVRPLVVLNPGVPVTVDHERHEADAAADGAQLCGAVPAEPAAGRLHGRASALPRGLLGAVLPAAAVLRGRRGDHLQGPAGSELRDVARLRAGLPAAGLAGLAE